MPKTTLNVRLEIETFESVDGAEPQFPVMHVFVDDVEIDGEVNDWVTQHYVFGQKATCSQVHIDLEMAYDYYAWRALLEGEDWPKAWPIATYTEGRPRTDEELRDVAMEVREGWSDYVAPEPKYCGDTPNVLKMSDEEFKKFCADSVAARRAKEGLEK